MILPEEMRHVAPRFAAAGLTAHLIKSQYPIAEDDQIKILRDGVDTRVTIQVSLVGGYHVNEYRSKGASFVMIAHGGFRMLRKAIDRAIEVVAAKQRAEVAS